MPRGALALTAAVLLAGCAGPEARTAAGSAGAGDVVVFAAASLTEAFTDLGEQFEAAHPGARVRFNFAGSSGLARQIGQGAPADVFASAAPAPMRQVSDAGGVAGEPEVFARNALRIAVPRGNPGRVTGLADFGREEARIALCAAQVPCGAAAEQVFGAAGVTPRPDTVEQDVKAALVKVRLGEVDAALVYRTDVRAAGAEVEGIDFPEADRAANDYPIAPLAAAPNAAGARAFVAFVRSDEGRAVLAGAGFDTP
ncbi:molybdate ABC transporter substrate-binding protein [Saccharothrix algeriensis]|uniref:Molybdate ABC transporter substrate-binding protein n=1 Tax=Saccharothrix algeriensis TaxID=173560 RepID=A0A8T8I0K4_9PSEU|nr:molybdate ABC transporter substrate-binding protein [Saccharothrix algeriensis]MBM7810035.1 molybdate transport system substrate-binding protein [Saccharothrix algeriensis]QTR04266.1 molybdate ABC transporter substrate-binding protein [Saccharothrix algeriensis]